MKTSFSSFCFSISIIFCILAASGPCWNLTGVEAASVTADSGLEASSDASADSGVSMTVSSEQTMSGSTIGSSVPSTFVEPVVFAQFAVLMDASTGQVLYKKSPNDKAYPASITKIMTLLLAVENAKETDLMTVSKEAISKIKSDEANIALQPGEQITMEQALNALMLASANDAANVIAESIGATQADFAVMMTNRAKKIGAVNTSFTNANGLSDDNHYTTAYDMALITREGLKNAVFKKYFSQITYTMAGNNQQPESRNFLTHHKMLYNTNYRYKYAYAGKTGYTEAAGSTLVTVANKDGHELICVTLKESAGEAYADARTLFEYGFTQFEPLVYSSLTIGNLSMEVVEDGKKVGTASIREPSDQTIWIPIGSGCTPEMIQLTKTDIDISKDLVADDSDKAVTSIQIQIPELSTPFFEPFVSVPLQASITLDPTPTLSPAVTDSDVSDNTGISRTIVTILKYIAGIILALAVLYLLYVIFMMFKVGYIKKLWRKIRKSRKRKTANSVKKNKNLKENHQENKNGHFKENKQAAPSQNTYENPKVRRVKTPKEKY